MAALNTADTGMLFEELLRYRTALRLQQQLEKLCSEHLPPSARDAKGLLPAAIFEGYRHAVEQASQTSSAMRTWVHPIIDVRRRAAVREPTSADGLLGSDYRLVGVQCIKGDILGVLKPLHRHASPEHTPTEASQEPARTISLTQVCLATPEPFYSDALIPALEAIEPHHASKNLLDLWLSKLCGAADKLDSSFNRKRKKAWQLTDDATFLFYAARKRLHEAIHVVSPWKTSTVSEKPSSTPPCAIRVVLHTNDAILKDTVKGDVLLAGVSASSSSVAATCVVVDVTWRKNVSDSASAAFSIGEWMANPHGASADASKSRHAAGQEEIEWTVLDTDAAHSLTRLSIPVTSTAVRRLYERYRKAQVRSTAPSDGASVATDFLVSLARLLLRYHGLCGGNMEKESGWQAAVPSCVMDAFERYPITGPASSSLIPPSFGAEAHSALRTFTVECFASPFNATRRFFFSIFPDTDVAFGSLGNFFACRDARMCCSAIQAREQGLPLQESTALLRLECNPPFDYEVIAAAFAHLLRWLDASASGALHLSVLIIIPDSTQTHAVKVRARLEQSSQCRWVRSLPAADCLYVHGAQQQKDIAAAFGSLGQKRPRDLNDAKNDAAGSHGNGSTTASYLVKLSCPTRVFVVQDDEAERVGPGASVGPFVVETWRQLSRARSS